MRLGSLLILIIVVLVLCVEIGTDKNRAPYIKALDVSRNKKTLNIGLTKHLNNLGRRLAACANLPNPSIAFLDNDDFRQLFPEMPTDAVATIAHLSLIDWIVKENMYIVFNNHFIKDGGVMAAEKILAHEIGHRIFEPTSYHSFLNDISGKLRDVEIELIASAIGNYRLYNCP